MPTTIVVAPRIDDETVLQSVLARSAFYFARIPLKSFTVVAAARLHESTQRWLRAPVLPDDYDPAAAALLRTLADKVHLVDGGPAPQRLAEGVSAILVWDIARFDAEGWAALRDSRRKDLALFEVDLERTRQEAAMLAEVAHRFDRGVGAAHKTSTTRLRQLVESVGGVQRAYLVATGPSATMAFDHDLSDGVGIVCNTVILDERLMDHVKPKVVTFADPIFHFGLSRYAGRFREAVLEQSRRHDFAIVIPERYVRHLAHLLPEVSDRIIGLRFGNAATFTNLDLATAAYVRPRPNILTMQMFPLGATLARELHLIGFDGREPGETYFWKHGATVQMHDELAGIKRVHPGFFKLDYGDYYDEHVASVESYVRAIEALGRKVVSLTPSHMPALRTRFPGHSPTLPPLDSSRPVLMTVDPDWVDDFGHFRPLNMVLQRCAHESEWQFVALGSRALRPEAEWHVPWFTYPTNNFNAHDVYGDSFREELAAAVATAETRDAPTVFAFYTAALWHLPEILRVLADSRGSVRFVVNLMRAHPEISAAAAENDPQRTWAGYVLGQALLLAEHLPLTITVDTEQLADDVETIVGRRPALWPMIALADPEPVEQTSPRFGGPVRVYCPARPQATKGYADFARLAQVISESEDAGNFVFIARLPAQPTEVPISVQQTVETLKGAKAVLLDKELPEEEYFGALREADIVVLPHRSAVFRTRTSAMLVDALRVGRPVVAVRGTWLGTYVERFGAGEVFEDGDVDDLIQAVRKVAGDLDGYLARLQRLLPEVEEEFSPRKLFGFITRADDPDHAAEEAKFRAQIDSYGAWTASVYQAQRQGHAAVVKTQITAVERQLAATLSARTRDMQIDGLRSAAAATRRQGREKQRLLAAEVHGATQRALRAERRLEKTRAQLERSRARVVKLREKVDRMSQRLGPVERLRRWARNGRQAGRARRGGAGG